MSLELLGADEEAAASVAKGGMSGILGPILQAAGEIAKGGVAMYEQHDAQEKASASDQEKLNAAISADVQASAAAGRAIVSAKLKSATAATDKSVAEAAAGRQARAAAALPASMVDKRIAAAEAALDVAVKKAEANPKSPLAVAMVAAWSATVNKASNSEIVKKSDATPTTISKGSWFTRPVVGPVPGWGVVAGGAGIATVGGLVLKKLLSH